MKTPSTAPNRSLQLSGRDFTGFFLGRIEIGANPYNSERLEIHFGEDFHSLFVAQQIIDVNCGDKTERLELPFLDSMPDYARSLSVEKIKAMLSTETL